MSADLRPSDHRSTVPFRSLLGAALATALLFALATSLGESGLVLASKLIYGQLTHINPQALWLGPVAYAVLFAVPAFVAAAVAWWRNPGWWYPLLVASLAFVSTYAILQVLGGTLHVRLHFAARALLSLGVAVRMYTLPRVRRVDATRPSRWIAPAFAASVMALAAATNLPSVLGERRALASLPDVAVDGAPNVLLIIWDTVGARSLSLYDYFRPDTPHLERLAARGATFDRAIATAPWSLPSHASMFTGLYPRKLSVGWKTALDDAEPMLTERLRDAGYVTAGFVANTYYCTEENGLARGMVHYEDYRLGIGAFATSTGLGRLLSYNPRIRALLRHPDAPGRIDAATIRGAFERWLDRREGPRPFFAFLNFFDAHTPYLPPVRFDSLFGAPPSRRRNPMTDFGSHLTEEQVRAEKAAYDGAIAYLDDQLGRILRGLRERGLLDNTIVVVASDHGEEFGEHGVFTHGNSLYLQGLHVPLVVVAPGRVPAGARVGAPVSIRDIPSTILQLAGLDPATVGGVPLTRFWDDGATPEPVVLAELQHATGLPADYPVSGGDMTSYLTDRYHYILDGEGGTELYDILEDEAEEHPLPAAISGPPPAVRRAIDAIR